MGKKNPSFGDECVVIEARYYDPQVGRFISEDPIGFAGGDLNLYVYVKNNPIMFIDPFGLAVGDWWDLPANFGRAEEIAREELQKRPTQHNDIGDATRHAEWNQRMVQETNSFTAWVAGVGHEIDNLLHGGPWNETMMDIHNNAEGRVAGQQGSPVNPSNLQTIPKEGFQHNPYSGNSSGK